MNARTVLTADEINRSLTRISHEILESLSPSNNSSIDDLVVLGIPTRGVLLADRLAAKICEINPQLATENILGRLDVTMYRDDLNHGSLRPVTETVLPASGIDGKVVVLVDDVLFRGRTIRAALDALNEFGRPKQVKLAVLVDRGHRELPIRADFVGKNLPTSVDQRINVQLQEIDAQDAVVISE